jgi:hypothetical protein
MTVCLVLLSLNLYGMDEDTQLQRNRDEEIAVLQRHVYELEKRVASLEYKLTPHIEFIGESGFSETTPLFRDITIDGFTGEADSSEMSPLLQDITIIELPDETR